MNAKMLRILSRALILTLPVLVAMVATVQAAAVDALSTGVGLEERTARSQYSLLLSFSEARGPYLANIAVEIKDAGGKLLLRTTSEGPWLYVKLPAGDYKVTATRSNGEVRAADVTVKESGQTRAFVTW